MRFKSLPKQSKSLLEQAEYYEEKGEIQIAGSDWILMDSATFRDLFKGTEKILGSGAAIVWMEAARHAGKKFTEALLRERVELEEVPVWLGTFFTKGGWGKIQTKSGFKTKEAVVKIENCATARQTKADESACCFIRGFIAGVYDAILDDSMECVETKCMAKGDAFCEFHVTRKLIG